MEGIVEFAGYESIEMDAPDLVLSLQEKNAMSYVDMVSQNDLLAAFYKNKGAINDLQVQMLAYRDFISPPQILGIYCEKFLSHRKKPIVIRTKDDVEVRQVVVKVYNSKNELLEKGFALQFLQKEKWFYFIRKDLMDNSEIRIEAKAIDFPGNMVSNSQWLML